MTSTFQESGLKKDSVTLACRFDRTLYDLLQKDSKQKGISLNALVNNIAKRYVSWEKYADEIGFIPLAKETVRSIFDNLDHEDLKRIAQHLGRTIPKELIFLMFNKIDFDSVVSFIELTSSRYGLVQHEVSGKDHNLTVYHGVNKKFSHFLAAGLSAMAEDLSLEIEVISANSRILSVKIKESSVV